MLLSASGVSLRWSALFTDIWVGIGYPVRIRRTVLTTSTLPEENPTVQSITLGNDVQTSAAHQDGTFVELS